MIPKEFKNRCALPILSFGEVWRYKTCAEMLADEIDKNEKARKDREISEVERRLKARYNPDPEEQYEEDRLEE